MFQIFAFLTAQLINVFNKKSSGTIFYKPVLKHNPLLLVFSVNYLTFPFGLLFSNHMKLFLLMTAGEMEGIIFISRECVCQVYLC